jgi:hypothetical protein
MVTILLKFLVDDEKNTIGSLAISMTIRMRLCDLARISQ